MLRVKVAALYVQTNGSYYGIHSVDPWDEARDARTYAGSDPVVAHPPCHLWTNLACVNFKRYGGAHNRPGNDGGCFASALANLRRCGGVMEHPAGSRAYPAHNLPKPNKRGGWCHVCSIGAMSEWCCEVWQSAYGHKARKRTWLYYVGTQVPFELNWNQKAGTHQIGWFDRNKPTLSKKEANATPIAFRDVLIHLAKWSRL